MAYCLLDAARMDDLMDRAKELAGEERFRCLYAGSAEETLSHVAPYLFMLQDPTFVDWILTEGWGQAWGVILLTDSEPTDLYRHLKRFLYVRSPEGVAMYFRYYDPRALRLFLPTCDYAQLQQFFGPVRFFILEDEDNRYAINCWLQNGQLQMQQVHKEEAHAYLKQHIRKRYGL